MTELKFCFCGAIMISEIMWGEDGRPFYVYRCINCNEVDEGESK